MQIGDDEFFIFDTGLRVRSDHKAVKLNPHLFASADLSDTELNEARADYETKSSPRHPGHLTNGLSSLEVGKDVQPGDHTRVFDGRLSQNI